MSKRKKRSRQDELATLILSIVGLLLRFVSRIIVFVYDLITYHTSSYGIKSGNGFIKTIFDKGNYGEFTLYRKVIRVIDKNYVLTNLYLDNVNTETTEVDVLAVTNKGIYVFEMKNYSGYIFGSEKDKNWTQVFNRFSKHKFYNPLRQNYAHQKSVENYLGVSKELIIPLVVFSNNSRLSKINVGSNHKVFQYSKALRYVKKTEKKSKNIITDELKEKYIVSLIEKSNVSDEIKAKHIEDVESLVKK